MPKFVLIGALQKIDKEMKKFKSEIHSDPVKLAETAIRFQVAMNRRTPKKGEENKLIFTFRRSGEEKGKSAIVPDNGRYKKGEMNDKPNNRTKLEKQLAKEQFALNKNRWTNHVTDGGFKKYSELKTYIKKHYSKDERLCKLLKDLESN